MMKALSMILMLLFLAVSLPGLADKNTASDVEAKTVGVEKEKSWWQKRKDRSDIYYPHKPHMDIMKDDGDACMLCHPYSKNKVRDEKMLKSLEQINNEPLEAICHECHVEKMDAPSECRLCHFEPATIWPQDHNYNYKYSHREDAIADQDGCGECHKQLSFCTDCHFKRNTTGNNVHRLGYRAMHGLDARIAPAECGSCHQASYCSDCHRLSR